MSAIQELKMPSTEEEFFFMPWQSMAIEKIEAVLYHARAQQWWRSPYAGFAIRSTGRGVEVGEALRERFQARESQAHL